MVLLGLFYFLYAFRNIILFQNIDLVSIILYNFEAFASRTIACPGVKTGMGGKSEHLFDGLI